MKREKTHVRRVFAGPNSMKRRSRRRPFHAAVVALLAFAFCGGLVRANAPVGRYTIGIGIVVDTKTQLTWQQPVSSSEYGWAAASSYCASLSLAGSGWRVPSVSELLTLVDESRQAPAIDPNAFPNTALGPWWTSSSLAAHPTYAWTVSSQDGSTTFFDVGTALPVRCTRSPAGTPVTDAGSPGTDAEAGSIQ